MLIPMLIPGSRMYTRSSGDGSLSRDIPATAVRSETVRALVNWASVVFVDQRLQQSKQPLYLNSQYRSVHPSRNTGKSTTRFRCKRYAVMKPFGIGHRILRHSQGRSADIDCHQHPDSIDERHLHEPCWNIRTGRNSKGIAAAFRS